MCESEAPRQQSLGRASPCTSPFRTVFPPSLAAHKGHEGCPVSLCSSHYLLCSDQTGQLLTETQQRNMLPKFLFKQAPLLDTGHTPFFLSGPCLPCFSVSYRKVGSVRALSENGNRGFDLFYRQKKEEGTPRILNIGFSFKYYIKKYYF